MFGQNKKKVKMKAVLILTTENEKKKKEKENKTITERITLMNCELFNVLHVPLIILLF